MPSAVLYPMGSVAQQRTEKTYKHPVTAFRGMKRLPNE